MKIHDLIVYSHWSVIFFRFFFIIIITCDCFLSFFALFTVVFSLCFMVLEIQCTVEPLQTAKRSFKWEWNPYPNRSHYKEICPIETSLAKMAPPHLLLYIVQKLVCIYSYACENLKMCPLFDAQCSVLTNHS